MPPSGAPKAVSKPNPPNSTQLKSVACVQKIFAKQHFEQLRLDFATTVGINPVNPYSKIFLDMEVDEVDIHMRNDALTLLKEQRLDIWLHLMNKCVSSNRFPGIALIQSILELLLSMNQKTDESLDKTTRRIQTVTLLFETVIDSFPPTWSLCSNVYKKLFYSAVNMEIDFKKLRMNATDGLFPILFALLDDVFKEVNDGNDSENGFDSMMNFQQFEKIESAKCSYTKLTRNEKVDRLFVVLNLLIKLCEIDLSVWIHRYPFQTRNFMSNPNTCPLIAHLLWRGKGCGEFTTIMQDVLRLFTVSVWIDFPDGKTDTLARLVNLMSVAVNLSESCENDNLITYPNIKRLTETFANELVKSIENKTVLLLPPLVWTFPYTVEFYINVIDKIRSPVIRMFVTLRILSKFTRQFTRQLENVSLRKIVDCITNESYKQYDEKVNDNDTRKRTEDRYPTYIPQMNKKLSQHLRIDRDEYLTLLLNLFKSYMDVYRTHDVLVALLSDNVTDVNDSDQYKKLLEKVQIEQIHRHDLDQMNKDAEQLRSVAKEFERNDKMPVMPPYQCQNVYLEASAFVRLQEDLEYLVKLKEMFDENVQVGDTFKPWRKTVGQYFRAIESDV